MTRTDREMYLDTLYVTMDLSGAETKERTDSLRDWQRYQKSRFDQFSVDTTGMARFLAIHAQGGRAFRYLLGRTIDVTIQCIIQNAVRSPLPVRNMRLRIAGSPFFKHRAHTYAIPDSFVVTRRR